MDGKRPWDPSLKGCRLSAHSDGDVRSNGGPQHSHVTPCPTFPCWETGPDAQDKEECQKSETSKESSWKSGAWQGGAHSPKCSLVVLNWKGCNKVPWVVFSNLITSLSCHQRTDWNLWRGTFKE